MDQPSRMCLYTSLTNPTDSTDRQNWHEVFVRQSVPALIPTVIQVMRL